MIPQDPNMLMSYINMKLRDENLSLEQLCEDLDIELQQLVDKLSGAGYQYNAEARRFW